MTIKLILKVCSVAALVLLVFAALGPAKWQLRSGLGWQFDHVVGYFGFTLIFCLAWQRPLVVGGALMAFAALLEGLQAFTPDRHADLNAALYSAGSVLAAALFADLSIRASRFATAITGIGRIGQPAIAVRLTAASSLRRAMVSRIVVPLP